MFVSMRGVMHACRYSISRQLLLDGRKMTIPGFEHIQDIILGTDDVEIVIGGGYIKFRRNGVTRSAALRKSSAKLSTTSTGRRITHFSAKSRNRLIIELNSLSTEPDVWATLTFPEGIDLTKSTNWKRGLQQIARDIRRKFPAAWFYWRLEPQPLTGRPHFHLLGFCDWEQQGAHFSEWLAKKWLSRFKRGSKACSPLADIRHVTEGYEKLKRYISKEENNHHYKAYVPAWACAGARWGKINDKNILLREEWMATISQDAFRDVQWALRDALSGDIEEIVDRSVSSANVTEARKLLNSAEKKKAFLGKALLERPKSFVLASPDTVDEIMRIIDRYAEEEEQRMLSGDPV